MSMPKVQDVLPDNIFFRIHRKYSVNVKKITAVDVKNNTVSIDEHINLPISRANKEELLEKLEWYN